MATAAAGSTTSDEYVVMRAGREAGSGGPAHAAAPFDVADVQARLASGCDLEDRVPALEDLFYAEVRHGKLLGALEKFLLAAAGVEARSVTLEKAPDAAPGTREHFLKQLQGEYDVPVAITEKLGLGWLGPLEIDGVAGRVWALRGRVGEPVGTDCGIRFFESLVVLAESREALDALAKAALTADAHDHARAEHTGAFTVYRWKAKWRYWENSQQVLARPLESVILPQETKERLLADLDEFHERSTIEFYLEHGIPYKRSYLFFGPPGAGKSSSISALAGHYKRNVCYLQLSHPDITDDNLKNALDQVPRSSFVVLEDVDALFDADRSAAGGKQSSLTFSGVLNALDGIGMATGTIFILTTNHRERLDPALIRNGRVDAHIYFCSATHEQIEQAFLAFYPGEAEAALTFKANLVRVLTETGIGADKLSMAVLQQYFVALKKATAAEAAERVTQIVDDFRERGVETKEPPTDGTSKRDADGKGSAESKKAACKPKAAARPTTPARSTSTSTSTAAAALMSPPARMTARRRTRRSKRTHCAL